MKTPRLIAETVDSFINPYPGCPYCNRRERTLTFARILFLVGLLLLGNKLIDYVEHDIQSQCCRIVKAQAEHNAAVLGNQSIAINPNELDRTTFLGLP